MVKRVCLPHCFCMIVFSGISFVLSFSHFKLSTSGYLHLVIASCQGYHQDFIEG